jgi:hypothetical protein
MMGNYHCEPSLSQLLDDPTMRALMQSDGVDPHALRSLIREAQQRIAAADRASGMG